MFTLHEDVNIAPFAKQLTSNESVVKQLEGIFKNQDGGTNKDGAADVDGGAKVDLQIAEAAKRTLLTLIKALNKNPTTIEPGVLQRLQDVYDKLAGLLSGIQQRRGETRRKIVGLTSQEGFSTRRSDNLTEKLNELGSVTIPADILNDIASIVKTLETANREVYAQATENLTPNFVQAQKDQGLSENAMPEELARCLQNVLQGYKQEGAVLIPSTEDTAMLSLIGPSISLKYNRHPLPPAALQALLEHASSLPYLEKMAKMPGGARVIAVTPTSVLLCQRDETLVRTIMAGDSPRLILTPEEQRQFIRPLAANKPQIMEAVQAAGYCLSSKYLLEKLGVVKTPTSRSYASPMGSDTQVFAEMPESLNASPLGGRKGQGNNWKAKEQKIDHLHSLGVTLCLELPLQ
jgi:hypothetical protein